VVAVLESEWDQWNNIGRGLTSKVLFYLNFISILLLALKKKIVKDDQFLTNQVVLNEEQGHWTQFWKYHNRRQTNGKSSFDPLALVT